MNWASDIIPHEILEAMAEKLRPFEQIALIKTPPEYTINSDYLTSTAVVYSYIDESGSRMGTHGSVDHPSFAALREHLNARGYIKIERGWWNGDIVLKPFKLNTYDFIQGDQFSSACAMGIKFRVKQKHESDRYSNET